MNEIQLVAFSLANEEYALEINNVQEIIHLLKITRVPHAAESIKGVINLRGNVIPVIDLRIRFGLSPFLETENTRIIITRLEGKKTGLIVDNVLEVVRVNNSELEPPPVVTDALKVEFLQGVAQTHNQLLIILDLKKVIDL